MPKPMKFQTLDADYLDDAIAHPDVFVQQKLDGIRALLDVRSTGSRLTVTMMSAAGKPLKSTAVTHVKMLVEAWARGRLTATNRYRLTFDGEIVDGTTWWVFDLPRSVDTDEATPLEDRLSTMEGLLSLLNPPGCVKVLPTARTARAKKQLVDWVRTSGGEGVMVKGRHDGYDWDGRVEHSLKVKFTHTADCVILERNTGKAGGKMNAVLGMAEGCEFVKVGQCSMIGKPDAQPGDVVEVRYLYVGNGGKLVQPTVVRLREDKDRADCTTDQMRRGNREVMGV